MKKHQAKGFTFKTAEKTKGQSQVKAREGVAVAGCSFAGGSWPDPVLRNRDFMRGNDAGSMC